MTVQFVEDVKFQHHPCMVVAPGSAAPGRRGGGTPDPARIPLGSFSHELGQLSRTAAPPAPAGHISQHCWRDNSGLGATTSMVFVLVRGLTYDRL